MKSAYSSYTPIVAGSSLGYSRLHPYKGPMAVRAGGRKGGFVNTLKTAFVLTVLGAAAYGLNPPTDHPVQPAEQLVTVVEQQDAASPALQDSESPREAITYETINLQTMVEAEMTTLLSNKSERIGLKLAFSRLSSFDDFIQKGSSTYGLDKKMLCAMFAQESKGELRAKSEYAEGPAQFTEQTAREVGIPINSYENYSYHPSAMVKGAKYFKQLQYEFNNPIMALIGYSRGPGNTRSMLKSKWYSQGHTWHELKNVDLETFPTLLWDSLPDETQKHIIKVYARLEILNNGGIEYPEQELWSDGLKNATQRRVEPGENLSSIARQENVPLANIKEYNPQIRQWDKVPAGYVLRIPNQ